MPTVLKSPHMPTGKNGRPLITRELADWMRQTGEIVGRYELIDGEIISKMGQNPPHAYVVKRLTALLARLFALDYIQMQLPIRVANADSTYNEPEPDAAVLSKPAEAYLKQIPGPPDVLVAFEVADTSVIMDIHVKSRLYARAEIPEYVVVDLVDRRVVLHRGPGPDGYAEVTSLSENDSFVLRATTDAEPIPVSTLLPPLS